MKKLGCGAEKETEIISADSVTKKKRKTLIAISEKFVRNRVGFALPTTWLEET
jgi:hypothetical protein